MIWLIVLVSIYAAYVLLGLAVQRRLMFPTWVVPDYQVDRTAYPDGVTEGKVATDAGTTNYLFIPPSGSAGPEASSGQGEPASPLVVFAHGNAEIIEIWPPLLTPYLDMGCAVLLVEYRGYGDAAGSPSQRAITHDFTAAVDAVTQRPDVDGDRLIYHGRSIGGGVVCDLARQRRPAAIVLQSTFTSAKAMAMRYAYPPWLMRDAYDNAAYLRGYDGPVLLMHGRRDGIIPFGHSRKLHEVCPSSTLVTFDAAGHNDVPIDSQAYWQPILTFLRDAGLVER